MVCISICQTAVELWVIEWWTWNKPTLNSAQWNIHPLLHGCFFRLTSSHRELTKDHVLSSAYVKIFRTVTRNAVNKSVWRKKDCSGPPLNKYAMNIWLSSLRIRAHLSWRTGKHLHVLHVLQTYSTCLYPGSYLIIVADAADAVSVNFFGRCKFLQI